MDYNKYFLELLEKLVAIPSVSENEEGCARFLQGFMDSELGMETELRKVSEKAYNVYGIKRGKLATKSEGTRAKKLLLGGHIDVVAAGEGWDTNPFKLHIDGDRAFGRGSFDMKGGLAAQLMVLKRLKDEDNDFCGDIELIALCDEERHSVGANAYVSDVHSKSSSLTLGNADFGIFGEPHFDNIVVGATGKVLLSLIVEGIGGHAAKPETGLNAINLLSKFLVCIDDKYSKLYEEGKNASHCILNIATKYEGYALNIPDYAKALLNKQLYVTEDVNSFIADLYEIYAREVGKGKLSIKREIPYYPSYEIGEGNKDLRDLLDLLDRNFGHIPELITNQSVSDANILYKELGIPVVLFGPAGDNLHKPNEYIELLKAYRYMDMLYDYIKDFFTSST